MQDHPDSATSLSQPESNRSQRSRAPAVRVGGVVKRFGSTTALNRTDGPLKVTGAAKYAYEYPVTGVTHVFTV